MDSRVKYITAAPTLDQFGEGFEFPVYQGRVMYGQGLGFPVFQGRQQYGAGIGDVFRGIWRFFRPVAIKGAQTLLKAGGEAIREGASVKDVLKSTLKPTIGSVLGATAERVAERLTSDQQKKPDETPAVSDVVLGKQAPQQQGSGKRKAHFVYKAPKNLKKAKHSIKPKHKKSLERKVTFDDFHYNF